MNAHPDQVLLDLGRQFNAAIKRARRVEPQWIRARDKVEQLAAERGVDFDNHKAWSALQRECGHPAAYAEFTKHHSEACRIMRAIYHEKATTLEGFAVKLAAVTFDQLDFEVSPKESGCDVAEKQLLRLSRQMTAVVQRPSRLEGLFAAFHEAKAEYDTEAEQTGFCDGPAYEAYEAAEHAIVRHPCQTIDEVRAKARFFIANSGPYDTIRNCFDAKEETLLPFLRSLTGETS